MSDYASEAGHWYTKAGEPAYTTIGKDGKERNTTLRDARKLGLLPSVTTIIAQAARPGLEAWKEDQTIMAVLTLPRIEGEAEAAYIARIKADSREQAKKAREKGTEIHGMIEAGFRNVSSTNRYFESAYRTVRDECGDVPWSTEKSFANIYSYRHYGGKVDLHSDDFLLDIKTTDKPLYKCDTWPEHHMQLAAYDNGLPYPGRKCGILYINVNSAESVIRWVENEFITRGEKCFEALLDFWYAKTGL